MNISQLDIELLESHVTGKSREWLIAHPDFEMPEEAQELIRRREAGEPLAYIIGKKEFYGRDFEVNPSVLIPRPSTETLIDLALNFLENPRDEIREADRGVVCFSKVLGDCSGVKTIVDIGTGSGCIAITLFLENPELKLVASDINKDAISVAERNAKAHNAKIDFRNGDLLDPVKNLSEPFILVSNPPYIPDGEELMKDVKDYEPEQALFSGNDGMEVLNSLMKQAQDNPLCMGVVIECKKEQAKYLLEAK